METINAHLGEATALLTAIIWALAVIMFKKSGEEVHPVGLNLFKVIMAGVLLVPTALLFGENLLRPAPIEDYLLLLLSGVLGIGIADTLFFKSLNALGAGLSAIVDCLYSPFIIGLSIFWIGESLTFIQAIGAAMIVSAVLTASSETNGKQVVDRRRILMGILWGALAMATMAVGIVMIKPLLNRSPMIWATEWRVIGGGLSLLLVLPFYPKRKAILKSIIHPKRFVHTFFGSFVGGYLAMVLWIAGMKFTQASTAAALNQTSNVFIFIFAAIFLHEKVTPLRLVGILLGVGGLFLVTFG